jgi:hypothetical protein
MKAGERANFARALDNDAQAKIAAEMEFERADFGAMDDDALSRKLGRLSAKTFNDTFGRFEANEDAFGSWTVMQKSAYTEVLGAKAFESAILQGRSFNRLSEAQQLDAWSRLGRQGEEAALRYAGLGRNELERMDAGQRNEAFERAVMGRGARD